MDVSGATQFACVCVLPVVDPWLTIATCSVSDTLVKKAQEIKRKVLSSKIKKSAKAGEKSVCVCESVTVMTLALGTKLQTNPKVSDDIFRGEKSQGNQTEESAREETSETEG